MRRLIHPILCISLFILATSVSHLHAQDLHYSQFLYSPLNLGASEAGNMKSDLRVAALHRRQWASVTVPYQSFNTGIDCKLSAINENLKGFGAGILINQDKTGDGEFQTLQANLSLSYSFPVTNDSVHFIRVGVQGGFAQHSLDISKLNFDSQFNGDNFNPLSPTGENFARTKYNYADLGIGAGWSAYYEKSDWTAGISFNHLNHPNQSFMSDDASELPVLTQIHAGSSIEMNENINLKPAINFMLQQEFREVNFGMEATLKLKSESVKTTAIGLGVFVRNNDAIIPVISLYWSKFRFGFSYDINTSSLNTASNGKGGPEFTLIYQSKRIRATTQHRVVCPVY